MTIKINAVNLVHPYYGLPEAAARLGCEVVDLLRLAATGRLELITPYVWYPLPMHATVNILDDEQGRIFEYIEFGGVTEEGDDWQGFFVVPADACGGVDFYGVGRFSQSIGYYVLEGFGNTEPHLHDARDGYLRCEVDKIRDTLLINYRRAFVEYSISRDMEVDAKNLFIRHAELHRLETGEQMSEDVYEAIAPIVSRVSEVSKWKQEAWRRGLLLKESSAKLTLPRIESKVCKAMTEAGWKTDKGKPLTIPNIHSALLGLMTIGVPIWERTQAKTTKKT